MVSQDIETSRAYWWVLLIPALYAGLELMAGPMGLILGTMRSGELGFFVIRVLPVLPLILIPVVSLVRRRMQPGIFAIFVLTMAILWLIDILGLAMLIGWGLSFHHGDLLE